MILLFHRKRGNGFIIKAARDYGLAEKGGTGISSYDMD